MTTVHDSGGRNQIHLCLTPDEKNLIKLFSSQVKIINLESKKITNILTPNISLIGIELYDNFSKIMIAGYDGSIYI